MARKLRMISFVIVFVCGLFGQSLFATTVAVGPPTCKPSLVHFSTIQAAVNASPFGTTIDVCPGTYPEQVVITEPLTVQGVTDGTGNAAVIAVPGGGLVVNASSAEFGPVTAQLLVGNTVGVTISDLIVDGTGSTCVAGANRTVGIEFFNVGTSVDGTTAGRIQNVVVRNQTNACGIGEGILSDTSFITINANEVHDIDRTGVLADSANNTITNNSVQRAHNYGIVLDNEGPSLVSANTVSDTNIAGILVGFVGLGSVSNATVSKNAVVNGGPSGIGIWLFDAFHSAVNHNQVSNAAWPMALQFAFSDTVQYNAFNEASVDGIIDQNSFGGNIVTKNTVNEAPFGIFTDSSVGGDTLVPNSLFNVVVTVDPNPADAPPAPSQI